jgi:MYXO-CTERM domain-containing protein
MHDRVRNFLHHSPCLEVRPMRHGVVWTFVGCVTTVCSVASADDLKWDRHPRRANPAQQKPAGVPSDYVLTHNGFFHPSCVVSIRSDEVLGTDSVIRGMDGVEHERIPDCAYPRFSVTGRAVPAGAPATERQARRRLQPDEAHAGGDDGYDGWVTWYDSTVITVAPGSTLVTEWVVPLPPTNVGQQDIAFFNDFETKDIILQPVLDFSEIPGEWAIESENCCGPTGNGNDVQSTLVQVSAGDVIRGEIDMASCAASGECTNWTVKTTDVTTGKSTSLTMQNPGEVADEVNPAVLETYSITSCDMLPANGEATFFDNALTNAGVAEPETYVLETILSPPAAPQGFPTTCGYGGTTSGNSYTLVFGTSPTPVGDAGGPPGSDDASAPVVDSGGGGVDSSASSGGDSGSSSGGGSGSSSGGISSGSGSGGILDAGSSSGSSSGSAETAHGPSSSGGGCGCSTVGAERGAGSLALGAGLLVLGGAVRRRRAGGSRVRRSRALP